MKGEVSVLKRQRTEKTHKSLKFLWWQWHDLGEAWRASQRLEAVKCIYDLDTSSMVERKGKTTFWSGNEAWDGHQGIYHRVNAAFTELSTWIYGHAGFLLDTCPLGIILEVSKYAVFLRMLCAVSLIFGYGLVLFRVSVRSSGPRKEAGLRNGGTWPPAGGGRYHQS